MNKFEKIIFISVLLILLTFSVNAGTANYISTISCVGGQESQCYSSTAIGSTDCSGDGCSTVCKDGTYKYGPGTAGGSGWMDCVNSSGQPVADGATGLCAWESIGSCAQDGQVFNTSSTGYCSSGWGCVYDQTVTLSNTCQDGYTATSSCTYKKRVSSAYPNQTTCTPATPSCAGHECSSTNLSLCTSESTCETTGSANWCQTGYTSYTCQTAACATCSSSNLSACYTNSACTNASGYWNTTTNTCSAQTQSSCTSSGKYWCPNATGTNECQSTTCTTSTCTASTPQHCSTTTNCSNVGAVWCESTHLCYASGSQPSNCSSGECSTTSVTPCVSQGDCTSVGGIWCSATNNCKTTQAECTQSISCVPGSSPACTTSAECSTASGYWCSTYNQCYINSSGCPSAGSCDTSNRYACTSSSTCNTAGGTWCSIESTCFNPNENYCCSNTNLTGCETVDRCTQIGAGYWCARNNTCVSSSSQCTNTSTCSSSDYYQCNDSTGCSSIGGTWCPTTATTVAYCSSPGQSCTTIGMCGNSSCNVGETAGTCPNDCNENTSNYCSVNNPGGCKEPGTCTSIGGTWCPQTNTAPAGCAPPGITCQQGQTFCGNYVCETGETQYSCSTDCGNPKELVCPPKDKIEYEKKSCTANKGIGKIYMAPDGCEYFSCDYSTRTTCPTGDDERKAIDSCKNDGQDWVFNYYGNCKFVECLHKTVCASKEDLKATQKKCESLGLGYYYSSDYQGCPNIQCKQQDFKVVPPTPAQCRTEYDAYSGYRYVCDTTQNTCPSLDSQADSKRKCYDSGGRPDIVKGPSGCEYYTCNFGEDNSYFFDYQGCPSGEELQKTVNQCNEEGKEVFTEIGLNGCKNAKCVEPGTVEQKTEDACIGLPIEKYKEQKSACENQDGIFVEKCSAYECISKSDIGKCESIEPEKAVYEKCAAKGGELIVRRDDNKCPVFIECVGRNEVAEFEDTEVTDTIGAAQALEIVFNLEKLNLILDKLERQTEELKTYYESVGNTENVERFVRVKAMFQAAQQEVESIKQYLADNADNLTIENLKDIKTKVKYIKKGVLKDILYVMLAKEPKPATSTGTDIKNCEESEQCFVSNLRVCQKAFMEHTEVGFSGKIEITGLEENKCNVKAAANYQGESYEMGCAFDNYPFADLNPESMQKYCSGTLIEKMKKEGIRTEQPTSPESTAASTTDEKKDINDPLTGEPLVNPADNSEGI
ncbi:MAG: hypothetical protein Q7S92_03735 [Candidatus Diapherotrites archaeon]|nr:hypothetical protein [Candidatus Diapherotrites archaeon]